MSDIELDKKEDLLLLESFTSKMKATQRALGKENAIYQKKGILEFGKSLGEDFFSLMEDMQSGYDAIESNGALRRISKEKLDTFLADHKAFQDVLSEYFLNTRVAGKVGDMFLDLAKESIESETKMDVGYNKDAALMSKEKMLENMPSVSVNHRV